MSKIVRLTESDLVRLVKKVLNEQPVSGLGKDLANLVNSSSNNNLIKIKLNGDMCDVVAKPVSKQSWGCAFSYTERGAQGQRQFNFNCNSGIIRVPGSVGTILNASPQAKNLLKNVCGCSSYVSNSSNQSTSNYV